MSDSNSSGWSRNTGWRQGSVLPTELAAELGYRHPKAPDDTCVVVISHDCDIANDDLATEPGVEIIVGRRLAAPSPGYTRTRSPRTLHLEIERNGGRIAVELVSTAKACIEKKELVGKHPDRSYRIEATSLYILRHWLAVRYNRSAFPEEFERRIKSKTDIADRLEKILRHYDPPISTVFFQLDTLEERSPSDTSPYKLRIFLAYEPGPEPDLSGERADEAAARISELFRKRCIDQQTHKWVHLELIDCVAVSEDEFPVSLAKNLQQWRLEHLSLNENRESAPPMGMRS